MAVFALMARVMALVEVPQMSAPVGPPSALEVRAARGVAEELGRVLKLVRAGAEAVLLMQLASVRTEGRPEGKGLFPGSVIVMAEEEALKGAGLRFAQAAFGRARVRGIRLKAPKVLLVLDTEGCFKKYRDLVHAREAMEEVLRALGVDFRVYIPPGSPTGLAPLPDGLLEGVDVVIDAAEIVGWGWDENAKGALRRFLEGGGAIIAIEAGCYRYVTRPGRGEAPVPEGGTLGLVEAEALHGGTGFESEFIKVGSPFFIRVSAVKVGEEADIFRRTGFKALGPGVVVLASDAAGVAQVLLRERILLIGPRIISHVHDRDFGGVSDFDRAYNFYNARLIFNALAVFCGKVVDEALTGPKWSLRPEWARMWERACRKVSEALAALAVREQELEETFKRSRALQPMAGYALALLRANWGPAREATLHLVAGEPREALLKARSALESTLTVERRLNWFSADQGRYVDFLLRFSKVLTESVERGVPADRFARACALANAAVALAKSGGMQQAAELLREALKILRGQRGDEDARER
ncbi:MAG TPA: hypothetical protein EYP65_01860 [Armatimonadetes bacterium]|nr:hypothetical protein [Armatimonadota bacterium]